MAWSGVTLFKLILFPKNGPPDAVRYIFLIKLIFLFSIRLEIEKCSESIGVKEQLYFLISLKINFQPQIMLSLFAIKILFENLIIFNVGNKPAIPEIAETVMSNLIFFNKFKSLIMIILFFLQKYFIFSVKIRLLE